MIKPKSKTTVTEDKKTPHKQRIRELIKRPKEKFLTKNQEEYWKILGESQITLCFGPAGVGKSYIAMKRAVDLLYDEDNKYEKIIIVRPAVEAEEKLGSLPGGLEEKLDPYIYPSYYLLNKIYVLYLILIYLLILQKLQLFLCHLLQILIFYLE